MNTNKGFLIGVLGDKKKTHDGFTLIELLIVVAIIAIIAAIIFVSLNPLKRFRDSRDSVRWADVTSIADAITLDQLDNGGTYMQAIQDTTEDVSYMIVDGAMDAGCNDNNSNCDVTISGDTDCIDLSSLVDEGYLGDVPVSPAGEVEWEDGNVDNEEGTGYVFTRTSSTITIAACESEDSTAISVVR